MQGNKCTQCHLSQGAFHTVNSIGHDNPDLYIIGDYPRQEDDVSGYPMTGGQYKFLWDMLGQIGVRYRVGYCVRCIPVDQFKRSFRKPETTEVSHCAKLHLFKELERMKPKAILLFGQIPVDLFFGEGTKIASCRERAFDYTLDNGHTLKVISTYHPNYVVSKNDEMFFNRFIEDVVYSCRYAMAHLSEGKYFTKTVNVDMFEKIVDMWLKNDEIDYIVYDTETNGLDPLVPGSKITSFSVSSDGKVGFNIYLYHPEFPDITDDDRSRIIAAARKLLTTKKVIAHHAKHEHRYTKVCFGFTPNIVDDTMYMAYILYMSYPGMLNNLKFLSGRFLAMPAWEDKIDRYVSLFKQMKRYKSIDEKKDQLVEEYKDLDLEYEEVTRFWNILSDPGYYIKHQQSDNGNDVFMWMIPHKSLERYAGFDVIAPYHLHKIFKPMIDADPDLNKAYQLLVKGAEVFGNIELKGVRVNQIEVWTERYETEVDKCIKELRKFPEVQQFEKDEDIDEYNPNSSAQNAKVLFTYLGFPVKATTAKGEPSTSETAIIDLIKQYQDSGDTKRINFLATFRRYKKLKKLLSSYFIGLRNYIGINNAFDGHKCETLPVPAGQDDKHIHPQYKLHGTETGRLSSSNPSMHTIPYHSDVKKMIVPHNYGRGGLFVGADQSQLELRVLAAVVEKYYGDATLADAYRAGKDIHLFNASKVFNKPMEDVLDAERRFAKTISFSIVYGSSERSVAEATGRTEQEVKDLFQSFFDSFPGVRLYIQDMHRYAQQYGCVRTPMGRLRHLVAALDPENRGVFNASMRQAQNTPIQSAGSDVSLMSIVYMDQFQRRQNMGSKVVAFVHDSITQDVVPGEFVECVDLLIFAMKTLPERMDWITCPLGVDLEISDNLGEAAAMKKYHKHDDGRFEMELAGYSYVIDNVRKELEFAYDILEDTLLKEEEVEEEEGDLIARKVINLSFSGQKFKDQKRRIIIKKKTV